MQSSNDGDDDNPATLNTHDEGVHFFQLLLGSVMGATVLAMGMACITRAISERSGQKDTYGIFMSTSWPLAVRGPLGLVIMHVFVLPVLLVIVATLFGAVLALSEDWDLYKGAAYVLSNLLGLQDPLTNVSPEKSIIGRSIDVAMSIYAMLIGTTVLATSASMCMILELRRKVPNTTKAFLRCLCIYIPLVLSLLSFLLGCAMAGIERWKVKDGFLFMVAAVAKLANPITDRQPATAGGALFEILSVCILLGLSGTVIGIVCTHPSVRSFVAFVEGTNTVNENAGEKRVDEKEPAGQEKADGKRADDKHAAELQQLRELAKILEEKIDNWRVMRELRARDPDVFSL